MNRAILLIVFPLLTLGFDLTAQNLIPDPGFEDWDGTIGANPATLDGLDFWEAVNGTPDHHHQLNPIGSNLTSLEPCPLGNGQNQCGYPLEGQAVLGCYKGNGIDGSKEWAAIEFATPLQTGICHYVSFWIQNKKDNPNFIMETNQWGMFFSNDAAPSFDPNTLDFNTVTNQYVTCEQVINDTIWHHVEWTYIADDNYNYAYVGYMGNASDAVTNAWSNSGSVGFYTWIDSVEVIPVPQPVFTAGPDVTACAEEDFQIYATSDLNVTWSTGASGDTLTLNELTPGVYTYECYSGEGSACEQMQTITVTVIDCNCPTPITATAATIDDTSCPTDLACNGEATATPDNGTAPFSFLWDDPAGQMTPTAAGLCPGTYACTVQDVDGCTTIVEVTIEGPEEAEVEIITTPLSCEGLLDGTINTTIIAGEEPFDYAWDLVPSPGSISGLDSGWHYLTITDAFGCIYNEQAYVSPATIDIIDVFVPGQICINAPAFLLDPSLGAGTWTGPGIINPTIGLFDPQTVAAGIHEIEFISNNSCGTEYNVTVIVRDIPNLEITPSEVIGCPEFSVQFQLDGPQLMGTYSWDFGDGTSSNEGPPLNHVYGIEGLYEVSLSFVDDFGCSNSVIMPELIEVISQPIAAFSYSPLTPTDFNNEVTFIDESVNATSWQWDFGNGQSSSAQSPSVVYDGPGAYLVSLYVASGNGCADSAQYLIRYDGEVVIWVPNSFTPDNDGVNDYFQVISESSLSAYEILIFNRWGELVFKSNDIDAHWIGEVNGGFTENGAGYYAPDGIYQYVITYTSGFGQGSALGNERLKGTITLIR
jgi:gliding motility-associated-like protein